MCACRNGGQCVAPKVGDKYNNDSKFIYQGCACSAGYTGRFCESDIDACKLNGQPCFKGSTCTDLKAPANITGYQCGPCPSGYSGNGIKCVGKSRMCPVQTMMTPYHQVIKSKNLFGECSKIFCTNFTTRSLTLNIFTWRWIEKRTSAQVLLFYNHGGTSTTALTWVNQKLLE